MRRSVRGGLVGHAPVGVLAVAAVLVVALLSGGTGVVTLAAPGAPAECRDVTLFAVNGSGAAGGETLAALTEPLVGQVGNRLAVVAVPGPEVGESYAASEQQAVTALADQVAAQLAGCPGSRVMLFGYSQGAQVAGDVAARIGSGQEARVPADRVVAVGLFGDPARDPSVRTVPDGVDGQGVLPAREGGFGSLASRTIQVCAPGDPVCSTAPGTTTPPLEQAVAAPAHTGYARLDVAPNTPVTRWASDSLGRLISSLPPAAGSGAPAADPAGAPASTGAAPTGTPGAATPAPGGSAGATTTTGPPGAGTVAPGTTAPGGDDTGEPGGTGTGPPTTAPETTAPETTAPETTAPETTAPETTEPETTAPETTAPETTAPERTVPDGSGQPGSGPGATQPPAGGDPYPDDLYPDTGDDGAVSPPRPTTPPDEDDAAGRGGTGAGSGGSGSGGSGAADDGSASPPRSTTPPDEGGAAGRGGTGGTGSGGSGGSSGTGGGGGSSGTGGGGGSAAAEDGTGSQPRSTTPPDEGSSNGGGGSSDRTTRPSTTTGAPSGGAGGSGSASDGGTGRASDGGSGGNSTDGDEDADAGSSTGTGSEGGDTGALWALTSGLAGFRESNGGNVEGGGLDPEEVESPNVPGRQVVKLEVPDGAKRSEVRPEEAQDIRAGQHLFFGYSAFLPPDFPVDTPDWQVVWQLHDGGTNTSPPVALEIVEGRLWLANVGDRVRDLGPVQAGRNLAVQLDIEFEVGGGSVSVHRDGQQVLQDFRPPRGTMIDSFDYLKTGIYRDADGDAQPATLFLNDLKIGESLASVSDLAGAEQGGASDGPGGAGTLGDGASGDGGTDASNTGAGTGTSTSSRNRSPRELALTRAGSG
ncbi:cutinase family protein [Actinomycetospora lemnae]|uniref:Cutinase family protein n=1 Tax=Actinomycetospora lemnae TaxID=3019891 RepID=A0ABT5SQX3_9PSEU|nr:cutinase family protein [Actinomycetospora sp. DW7H6]MDD7965248.1 cutinase family protein [Actinomycetospora sp. DW7H6]